MFKRFILKFLAVLHACKFLYINFISAVKLNNISKKRYDEIIFRGLESEDLYQVKGVLDELNQGIGFSFSRRLLYRIFGKKLVIVAERVGVEKIIAGVDIFYFNRRDQIENTVHEGFIGVLPGYQSKGLATQLRNHAIDNFSKSSLSGISTRISLKNSSSLNSAKKLGFEPVEKYFDDSAREERYYMICKLRGES